MESATKTNLVEININNLNKDPNHPRQKSGDLRSLSTSIRHDGLMTPISVAKVGDDKYHVIDGWRRIEALKGMGMTKVSCFVYEDLKEADTAHKSFILNTERNQLNEIEIALHIKKMRDDFGYTYQELDILGYGSSAKVSKQISLLDLPAKIQNQIASGILTKAHGYELNKLKDEKQILKTGKFAVANDWSAKKTKVAVECIKRKARNAGKDSAPKSIPDDEVPGVYFKDAKDMSELDDGSVGLIFTSPPYHVGMKYEAGYTYAEHLENIEGVLEKSAKALVPGGIFAINVANITNFKGKNGTDKTTRIQPMLHFYNTVLQKHGFHLQDELIWVKDFSSFTQDDSVNYTDKTAHAEYRIVNRHEPIYIFKKKGERPVPEDGNIVLQSRLTRTEWEALAPSVWKINPAGRNQGHPNVFPEELARRIIKMYSYIGETVLDPFLGSGTTIKVARELGREGVGYERDLNYKATIMEKLGVVEEVKPESVKEYADKQLAELEANQPAKPEAEAAEDEKDYSVPVFGYESAEKELEPA